jgi:phosphate/sulfate permease
MNFYLISLYILALLALFDLIVGVSNDAVNFLNSSIGSRAAPRHVITIVASLGILAGVTFSSGMMEVARKGIFHPQFFRMPELITIFLAVMLTDIILLDLFNTFALPTSTTVSIVFELLGAAVALSVIKINATGDSLMLLGRYINSGKALVIISGILLSVVISFFCGALAQAGTRFLFTFDYKKRLKRYGGLWGGLSLSIICYFILIKGAKGASFITPEALSWMSSHTCVILSVGFVVFAVIFQLLASVTRINILKPIVLIGTFALAMAFAANDLVNFIGVPLAALNAYTVAMASGDPLHLPMAALQQKVPSSTGLLLIAGAIMVITLWSSKKARGVTATEVNLSRQAEGSERFDSTILARAIVRMALALHAGAAKITPPWLRNTLAARYSQDVVDTGPAPAEGRKASFDMLRASVNLMVASALVSFATSMKLPLSTTYVTFMVAMGTSLADQAWGRESAVYRITGVLTVIAGWFFTAFIAFTISLTLACFIHFVHFPAVVVLLIIGAFLIYRNFAVHSRRAEAVKTMAAFSLKAITSEREAIRTSLEHAGKFLFAIRANLSECFDGIIAESRATLKEAREKTKLMQQWTNVIIANTFKTLYLLQKKKFEHAHQYIRTIRSLQEIVESHRDLVIRAFQHLDNHHTGLTFPQKEELAGIKTALSELLNTAALMLQNQHFSDMHTLCERQGALMDLVARYDANQTVRIGNGETKTRLSILFYGFLDACVKISDHTLMIMTLFRECFELDRAREG